MKIKSDFSEFKKVLTDVKIVPWYHIHMSSHSWANVRGKYRGYSAEFGSIYYRKIPELSHFFYRLQLKKTVRLPWLSWEDCLIDDSYVEEVAEKSLFADYKVNRPVRGLIRLYYGKWVTLEEGLPRKSTPLEQYAQNVTEQSIRFKFNYLLSVVEKVEQGKIDFKKISRTKRKDWMQFIVDLIKGRISIR